ncbi:hypothetical protein EW145_g2611 [Phellinidium pouzarii]|uniref:F-box domain-containing protein n=1 Tax=Phellinidium pouzarii TaxID=167371 RepID=A0A4S4LBQ3_9AGAM|nr:hypothetical protein EW145_g2611 [Phellinidium pouzarii]
MRQLLSGSGQSVQSEEECSSDTGYSIHGSSDSDSRPQEGHCPSPIQALVPDILACIFMFAIPKGDFDLAVNWNRNAPHNVVAVCRYWRAVALSHTMLWAVIRLRGIHPHDCFDRRPFPWNQFYYLLQRSDEAPLDLSIDQFDLTDKDYVELTSFFSTHQHRCKHIHIDCDANVQSSHDFSTEKAIELTNIPLLESLHIHWNKNIPQVQIHLKYVPSLTALDLSGRFSLHLEGAVTLKLIHITLSTMCLVSPHECLMLLRICPALVSFSAEICLDLDTKGHDDVFSYICNPGLTTFKVLVNKLSVLQYILQPLHFPTLKDLTIMIPEDEGETDALGISALISRSSAPIESLHLHATVSEEIIQCLELLPGLEDLTVDTYIEEPNSTQSDFVTRLDLRREDALCPKLKSIALVDFMLFDCTDEVISMVTSRWDRDIEEGSRTLQRVSFTDCDLDDISDLDRCREEGLILEVEREYDSARDSDYNEDPGLESYEYKYTGYDSFEENDSDGAFYEDYN